MPAPLQHVVGPVHPWPPHWPYTATQPADVDVVVTIVTVDVDVEDVDVVVTDDDGRSLELDDELDELVDAVVSLSAYVVSVVPASASG